MSITAPLDLLTFGRYSLAENEDEQGMSESRRGRNNERGGGEGGDDNGGEVNNNWRHLAAERGIPLRREIGASLLGRTPCRNSQCRPLICSTVEEGLL